MPCVIHETTTRLTRNWQGDALTSLLREPRGEAAAQADAVISTDSTGLPLPTLQWVGRGISDLPKGFSVHPTVAQILDARRWVPGGGGDPVSLILEASAICPGAASLCSLRPSP